MYRRSHLTEQTTRCDGTSTYAYPNEDARRSRRARRTRLNATTTSHTPTTYALTTTATPTPPKSHSRARVHKPQPSARRTRFDLLGWWLRVAFTHTRRRGWCKRFSFRISPVHTVSKPNEVIRSRRAVYMRMRAQMYSKNCEVLPASVLSQTRKLRNV